ncbi:MAG TPA: DinB family protein [Acidimicrobiia bacterium]|nr:DinB family protein [Acidimicrobiia bacterium]
MRDKVIAHLTSATRAHRELIVSLPEADLDRKLGERSNTIGAQIWCVVGARESHTRAIREDAWAGFDCSLSGPDTTIKERVLEALDRSEEALIETLGDLEWTDGRELLLLDLLEHEIQHQGQLIRYIYALGHRFPESWATRWALEQPG